MVWGALLFLLALAKKKDSASTSGGSSKCADSYLWKGTKVVPLCKSHFPSSDAQNGWLVLFQGEDLWQQKLVQEVRQTWIETAKAHAEDKSEDMKGLKFGAVPCYTQTDLDFCKSVGVTKFPAVFYTDGSRVELFPKVHSDLRTVASGEYLEFAKKQKDELGGERHGGSCAQGIFTKDSEDAVVPLCENRFITDSDWIVAFYDKSSKHEDKALRVGLNKLAKSFGNSARSKKSTKKVSVRVGAVLCAKSDALCETHGTGIKFFRGGILASTFESFVDIDELKSWAKTAIATPEDKEALQQKLASLEEEKAAAVGREDYKEAKRLKGAIEQLEQRINQKDDKEALHQKLASLIEEKAAAVGREDYKEAKRLKASIDELQQRINLKVPEAVQEMLGDPEKREQVSNALDDTSVDDLIKMIDDPAIMDMMPAGFAEPGQKKYLKEAMKAPGFADMLKDALKDPEDMEKVMKNMMDPARLAKLGVGGLNPEL